MHSRHSLISEPEESKRCPPWWRGTLVLLLGACQPAVPQDPPPLGTLGCWLAPRQGAALDSAAGSRAMAEIRGLGARFVAVGQDVQMPELQQPLLRYGDQDAALRGTLRRARKAGLRTMLMPRIESPAFFEPPYPFRADIRFEDPVDWQTFHRQMRRMLLHYARLAQEEGVAIFCLGLELKHSSLGHPEAWREMITAVRQVYSGKLGYSANWYEEWHRLQFWDALDFIGIGAYFELQADEPPSVAALVVAWQPILARIEKVSRRFDKPVWFTEIGYPGFADCARRPWEWAGKAARGAAIDHQAQRRAWEAVLRATAGRPFLAGMMAWTAYTDPEGVADWEYGILRRPVGAMLQAAARR